MRQLQMLFGISLISMVGMSVGFWWRRKIILSIGNAQDAIVINGNRVLGTFEFYEPCLKDIRRENFIFLGSAGP